MPSDHTRDDITSYSDALFRTPAPLPTHRKVVRFTATMAAFCEGFSFGTPPTPRAFAYLYTSHVGGTFLEGVLASADGDAGMLAAYPTDAVNVTLTQDGPVIVAAAMLEPVVATALRGAVLAAREAGTL